MSDGRVDGVRVDEPNGPRVRIKAGWLNEGLLGTVIGAQVFLGQWWCPVLWDGEEDPDWNKSAGLELAEGKVTDETASMSHAAVISRAVRRTMS